MKTVKTPNILRNKRKSTKTSALFRSREKNGVIKLDQTLIRDQWFIKGKSILKTSEYILKADFWFETFQNWQSEFLSVASIVVFTIFLRQKGSPESKPVDTPNLQTEE